MAGPKLTSDPMRPAIAWSWRNAGLGAAYAIPAALATPIDRTTGLALAIGVLPAAALGLRGPRRQRALVIVVGAIAGVSMFLGSVVANHPVLAVLTIFALAVGLALLSTQSSRRLAPVALGLGLPLVGAGLSESGPAAGAQMGMLMLVGSTYGWLVSLLWPATSGPPTAPRQRAPRAAMLPYGIQIGAAGAAAAALGLASGIDHPGWACTAALLVSRPSLDVLYSRALGRALAVTLGAVVACTVAATGPGDLEIAVLAALALAAAAATAGSRWYVMPAFSTVIVLSLLLAGGTGSSQHWFVERVGQTLVGVTLALVAAWITHRTTTPPSARVPRTT